MVQLWLEKETPRVIYCLYCVLIELKIREGSMLTLGVVLCFMGNKCPQYIQGIF